MTAILLSLDGTLCDTRLRHNLREQESSFTADQVLADQVVAGSVEFAVELSHCWELVYLGARPAHTGDATVEWLERQGFPWGNYS